MVAYDQGSEQLSVREERPRHFVISVDYGTTFTGVAWALTTENAPTLHDVNVVPNWGEEDINLEPKVPSEYTYSANDGENWGRGIGDNAFVIRWTKLELERPTRSRALKALDSTLAEAKQLHFEEGSIEIPRHLIRSSVDVVTDYLYEVAKCVRRDIEAELDPATLSRFPIDLVITHPAIWDSRAKNLTFRAVRKAFMDVFHEMEDMPGAIRLATEPEACAQYTMRTVLEREEGSNLRLGDCFIVVDAGGGTVDLASYQVKSLSPFEVTRVTEVSGGEFGATKVDEDFLLLFLKDKLTPEDYEVLMESNHSTGSHVVLSRRQRLILSKFIPIKHGFRGPPPRGEQPSFDLLELPEGVGLANDPQRQIQDQHLKITSDDLVQLFKRSVDGTLELILKQLVQIDRKGLRVSTIFLSGGFSRNEYLYRRVHRLAQQWRFQLLRGEDATNDSWTAVCIGGALMGLGVNYRPPPSNTACPVYIGIVVAERFADYEHELNQKYQDSFDKADRARNQIKWVVNKGDLIPAGEGITNRLKVVRKMTPTGSQAGTVKIAMSTYDGPHKPPSHFSQPADREASHPVISLDYDLKDMEAMDQRTYRSIMEIPKKAKYHKVVMEVEIMINDMGGRVNLICGRTEGFLGGPGAPGFTLATTTLNFPPAPRRMG